MRDKTNLRLQYMQSLFARKYQKLEKLYIYGEKKGIQIGSDEGKLLGFFIETYNIKNIVEVGTLYGYSSICMAQALSNDGRIYTIEVNSQHSKIAKKNFSAFGDQINLIEGDALLKLNELSEKAPFDMIFIDADKSNYCKYLDWAELNIKQGGLIIADNTLLFDTVFLSSPPCNVSKQSWHIMREFNERLSNEEKYNSILIPTENGMTIALKLT
ncbi:MAG: O-methyltransferase [Wolbachia endosymbiont of Fragariocoptes setiger]|nr:O-methyltransferase [Wolbachia endosymbiont of Fragariocoptes setiger]